MLSITRKFMQKFCIIQYLIKEQKSNEIMATIGTILKIIIQFKMDNESIWYTRDAYGFYLQIIQNLPKFNENDELFIKKKEKEIKNLLQEAWRFSVIVSMIPPFKKHLSDKKVNKYKPQYKYNQEIKFNEKKYQIKGITGMKNQDRLLLLNTYQLLNIDQNRIETLRIPISNKIKKNKIKNVLQIIDDSIDIISKKSPLQPLFFCTDISRQEMSKLLDGILNQSKI